MDDGEWDVSEIKTNDDRKGNCKTTNEPSHKLRRKTKLKTWQSGRRIFPSKPVLGS